MALPLSNSTAYAAGNLPAVHAQDLNDLQTYLSGLYTGTYSLKSLLIDGVGGSSAFSAGAGHLIVFGPGTPTLAAGTGAGTSPTVSIVGSDTRGTIIINTGSAPAASSTVLTATFAVIYPAGPTVYIVPANTATAALSGNAATFVSNALAASFTIGVGSTALAASTQYKWNYFVIG